MLCATAICSTAWNTAGARGRLAAARLEPPAPQQREGSRRNIAAHYDLGNDFFALFLSPDLMYSSALFDDEDEPLEWRRGAS